jgi:predicted membrane protein
VGYAVALGVNAVLLGIVNVTPGWEAVPFLTEETRLVLGLVNASLITAIVVNAAYLLADPTWLKALGDVTCNVVGIAAMVQIWQVFPFAFDDSTLDWPLIARWVLAVGVAGSVIGLIVGLVSLVRSATARP